MITLCTMNVIYKWICCENINLFLAFDVSVHFYFRLSITSNLFYINNFSAFKKWEREKAISKTSEGKVIKLKMLSHSIKSIIFLSIPFPFYLLFRSAFYFQNYYMHVYTHILIRFSRLFHCCRCYCCWGKKMNHFIDFDNFKNVK